MEGIAWPCFYGPATVLLFMQTSKCVHGYIAGKDNPAGLGLVIDLIFEPMRIVLYQGEQGSGLAERAERNVTNTQIPSNGIRTITVRRQKKNRQKENEKRGKIIFHRIESDALYQMSLLQSLALTVTQSIKLFIIKAEKMGDFVDDGDLDLLK